MTTKRKIKLECYVGINGRWYWRARSNNGQIIGDSAQGNGYRSRAIMLKSLESFCQHVHEGIYEIVGEPKKRSS